MKETLAEKKPKKPTWIKLTALAACMALLIGTVLAVPGLREGVSGLIDDIAIALQLRTDPPVVKPPVVDPPVVDPPIVDPPVLGVEPYMPGDAPWSPIIHSQVKEVVFSVDDILGIVEGMTLLGTTQYRNVYAITEKDLGIVPLPNAGYLPVYREKTPTPSKEKFESFIKAYFDSATAFFGVDANEYKILQYGGSFGRPVYYEAVAGGVHKKIFFEASNNQFRFSYSGGSGRDRRLMINGGMISVSASDTDEQIKEKLKDFLAYTGMAIGKNYTDIKIRRWYGKEQLDRISIYLYTPEETTLPPGFTDAPAVSEYIELRFYTDHGENTQWHWGGSKEKAYLINVSLCVAEEKWSDYYSVNTKAKMLTVEEAELLLEKGYVFGGHSCPICMANQPEVDFSEYTCVNIEYLTGGDMDIYVPFYAFYKYTGETSAGIGTYAKTYVPAVEIEGLEEYFKLQESKHPK